MEASPTRSSARERAMLLLGVAIVAAGWTVLRLAMNRQYGAVPWQLLVELRAPLPFGHRILVPLLVRPFVDAGVPIAWTFAVSEWLATGALVLVLRHGFARDLPLRAATLGAFGVLGVLSFAQLLAHRWNVFYPWDTWAAVAIVAAVDAIRRDRLALASAITIVGAYNRESVALVPVLGVLLRLEHAPLRPTIAWAVLTGLGYLAARASIDLVVPDAGGAPLHLWLGDELRLLHNVRWLSNARNQLQWWASLAMLPLAWLALVRWIPRDLQRTHLAALLGLCGLLVVANAYEPRVYVELIALAWCAVWTGAWRWASDAEPLPRAAGWVALFDRAAAPVVVALAIASCLAIASSAIIPR